VPTAALSERNEAALRQLGAATAARDGLDGRGILIGFADYGFDILHPCLLDATGTHTRLSSLWDQNPTFRDGPRTRLDPGDVADLDRTTIDRMLSEAGTTGSRAVADTVYDPHANYFTRRGVEHGAHGTIITSIAAGTPSAGFSGVAPGADLIGVQLALPEHRWKEVDEAGVPTWTGWNPAAQRAWDGWRSYDESVEILAALDYIHAKAVALNAPGLVVNLSIGAWAGAHDGRSAVERKITELVANGEAGEGPATAVIVVAGNAGAEDGHFAATVTREAPASFTWRMGADDPTQNKLEIWYEGVAPLGVALAPVAHATARFCITPGPTQPILLGDRLVGIADHVVGAREPLSRVRILLHPPYLPRWLTAASGAEVAWTLQLGTEADTRISVHAWLERDDGIAERSTLDPSHPTSTLATLACAEGAIAVAAHDHQGAGSAGLFAASALGPKPWQRPGDGPAPIVSAPGHCIWGARSKTQGFTLTSGTSAACAFVSGAIALLMQEALGEGRRPTRETLLGTLLPADQSWSPRFGYGPASIRHRAGEVRA
jgi:hypothetical protein